MEETTTGNVYAFDMDINARVIGKQMTFANFKKWVLMAGVISKGRFYWIPTSDQFHWSEEYREFASNGDTVEILTTFLRPE